MPSAVRRNENTIASRIKLVITSTREGARISSVRTTTTFSEVTSCAGVSGALKERFTLGIVVGAASARLGNAPKAKVPKISATKITFDIFGVSDRFCQKHGLKHCLKFSRLKHHLKTRLRLRLKLCPKVCRKICLKICQKYLADKNAFGKKRASKIHSICVLVFANIFSAKGFEAKDFGTKNLARLCGRFCTILRAKICFRFCPVLFLIVFLYVILRVFIVRLGFAFCHFHKIHIGFCSGLMSS